MASDVSGGRVPARTKHWGRLLTPSGRPWRCSIKMTCGRGDPFGSRLPERSSVSGLGGRWRQEMMRCDRLERRFARWRGL